jgi:hypothetical protein
LELETAEHRRRSGPTRFLTRLRSSPDAYPAMLGEDEGLLWDPVDQLEPEDGCLWVYGVGDEQTIAFTDRGLESLQEIIAT